MTTSMPFESKLTSLMYGQSPKKFADCFFIWKSKFNSSWWTDEIWQ